MLKVSYIIRHIYIQTRSCLEVVSARMIVRFGESLSKPAFTLDGKSFFCNMCNSYTANFPKASVRNRDRRCRPCLAQKRKEKIARAGHLQRLRRKLYTNLMYQKKTMCAKKVTEDWVAKLLEDHGIAPSDYDLVKTIKAFFDPTTDKWTVIPVLFTIQNKETDVA